MAHEHGPHTCYCPSCGYQVTVDTGVQCNTLTCPQCGQPMRALETGEYRSSRRSTVAAAVNTDSISCPVCGYPIPDPRYEGAEVKCAYCGTISQTIAQDVTVPTWLVAGVSGFVIGVALGPSILASIESGSQKLARKARERLA